ncbi:MAG: hypothetical protein IPK79_00875 [Vampirovibrionales bacterium]|nr:hypothetical protein [Vampirovibrionales bacterium]
MTVSALAAEIDAECERISRKGAVNGYASLNSSGYVPSAQLAPADAAATDSDEISWSTATSNMTVPVSTGEVASQNRRWQRDLTLHNHHSRPMCRLVPQRRRAASFNGSILPPPAATTRIGRR